jgi:predicted nuclease of predicted toxin-antitoxin system
MRFLVDAQLPPALARWIESQGYVAEHVHDFAGEGASDRSLWVYAATVGLLLSAKTKILSRYAPLNRKVLLLSGCELVILENKPC